MIGLDIEWERYEYTTPKGNTIEIIREMVYTDHDEVFAEQDEWEEL